ncbi:MAG: hypothetical protein WC374_11810 [Phycisphaerae bacterium]|jgi:hypothetical protein
MCKRAALILFLVSSFTLAAEQPPKPLLRDGFVLMGVDGTTVALGDKWYFQFERNVTDAENTLSAGTKLQLLPSTGLEKMVEFMKDNPERSYRLYNAIVTVYDANNYLFCDYFLPLSEVPVTKPDDSETTEEVKINEPNDLVMIPQEIIDRLQTPRVIRPQDIKQGMELRQDSILSDRTGYIKQDASGNWIFQFDALGRNTSDVYLILLPCQKLAEVQRKQGKMAGEYRFKVSGIVTKYQGRFYMMLNTATRTYNNGNFGG